MEQEENLQNDISQRSAEFRAQSQTQSRSVTIEAIQKALPQGTALIEFAQYHPSDPKETKTEKRYGKPRCVVYVFPGEGEPRWVELGSAELINRHIDAFRMALRGKRRKDVKRLARSVDRLVMQSVRELLGSTRQVFLSPDSALNQIPFAALMDEYNQYLVKRYHFIYLTSGRDLLRLQEKVKSKNAPVVLADADFGMVTVSDKMSGKLNGGNGASGANDPGNASEGQVAPKLGEMEFEPLKRLAITLQLCQPKPSQTSNSFEII